MKLVKFIATSLLFLFSGIAQADETEYHWYEKDVADAWVLTKIDNASETKTLCAVQFVNETSADDYYSWDPDENGDCVFDDAYQQHPDMPRVTL